MSNTGDKHESAENVKHVVLNVAEKTKDAAQSAGEKVGDTVHEVAEKTKHVVHYAGEKINERRPLIPLAAAFMAAAFTSSLTIERG